MCCLYKPCCAILLQATSISQLMETAQSVVLDRIAKNQWLKTTRDSPPRDYCARHSSYSSFLHLDPRPPHPTATQPTPPDERWSGPGVQSLLEVPFPVLQSEWSSTESDFGAFDCTNAGQMEDIIWIIKTILLGIPSGLSFAYVDRLLRDDVVTIHVYMLSPDADMLSNIVRKHQTACSMKCCKKSIWGVHKVRKCCGQILQVKMSYVF